MALEQNSAYTPSPRIVSPGVFTREIDQSFLAQGVEQIGGVVVAPFPKGPGFSPTVIRSEADLVTIFGNPDGKLYGPYAAQQYIRQQGEVTVVRVGGLAGYEQDQALFLTAIPGSQTRYSESGSFTGKSIGTTISQSSGATFIASGTLSATFSTGLYAGSTIVVGTFTATVSASNYTGSTFVAGNVASAVLTGSSLPHVSSNAITVSGSLVVTAVSACASEANWSGNITGLYGNFNTATWVATGSSSEDACGGLTSSLSGRDEVLLAVLANTALDRGQLLDGFSGSVLTPNPTATVGSDYRLLLKTKDANNVTSSYGTYDFSIDQDSSAYITNVFGTNPQAGYVAVPTGAKIEAAYVHTIFDDKISTIMAQMLASGSWQLQAVTRNAMTFADGITPDVGNSSYDLTNAYTPWINSQAVANWAGSTGGTGSYHYNLFKVHTLADGTDTNKTYKIEIANVRSAGSIPGSDYGSFSLIVRDYADTDKRPSVLEKFDNLDLNPDSANFVGRRIGDMYNYIDYTGKILSFGSYNNVSKLIRIETATAPWPVDSLPYGFSAYSSPIGGDYARRGVLPAMAYSKASTYLLQPGRWTSGVLFAPAPSDADAALSALYPSGSSVGPETDNAQYFAPIPQGASAASNVAFDLYDTCGVSPLYVASTEATTVKKRRFVLGFQGGFSGQSPSIPVLTGDDILATNQQGLDCSTNTSRGSYGYKQALAALSNSDEYDFNLIITPGINYQLHPYVVNLTVETVENRGDAFYIMDIAPNQLAGAASMQNSVDLAGQFDTNYAATYYPWLKIVDSNTNKVISVPPSVAMMAVFAANDKVAAEWFAPAGLNRGGIPAAVQVVDRLTHSDRDVLYEGKVNPIAAFPGQGIVAWGQKTLQRNPSALDRINVRRLMIALKKFIASSSRYLVFEQNVSATRNRFLSIVNPYLESVQQRSGLYAFKVVMDDSNNTPDLVDRGILYGQIYLKPSRTAEFIVLDFNVMATGATFPNA
jgi:hypothetical protein